MAEHSILPPPPPPLVQRTLKASEGECSLDTPLSTYGHPFGSQALVHWVKKPKHRPITNMRCTRGAGGRPLVPRRPGMRLLDGGWGVTTTGPDATPPPRSAKTCGAGGGGKLGRGGGGVRGRVWGGGGDWKLGRRGLRAAHYYHMHTSKVCVCVCVSGGMGL